MNVSVSIMSGVGEGSSGEDYVGGEGCVIFLYNNSTYAIVLLMQHATFHRHFLLYRDDLHLYYTTPIVK